MNSSDVKLAVIGLGHWGPNHVRVLEHCENAAVVAASDLSEARRAHISKMHHHIEVTADTDSLLTRKDIDAVVIATPVKFHHMLAKKALENGKHVLLEKPMCQTMAEAQELVDLSRKLKKTLMHGHVFLYNKGIQFIKEALDKGDFGRVEYLDSTRTNLGPIRNDINVVRDLVTHEFSIFHYFFGMLPKWISASGSKLIGTPREDVAFLTMEYSNGVLAHVHASWLHPQKIRNLTVVCSKKMAVWNDLDASEPVRIYDKGVAEEPYYNSFGEFQAVIRESGMSVPKISVEEPLGAQAKAFIRSIREGAPVLNDAEKGIAVMRCLEAAEKSLSQEGRRIAL